MLIKQAPDIRSSEITPERVYRNRRQFIQTTSGVVAGAIAGGTVLGRYDGAARAQEPIPNLVKSPLSTDDELNSYEDITSYNNFYEFGTDKEDPARYAHEMSIDPWSVRVDGEMHKPAADVAIEDLLRPHTLEERIYRLRCVEAWSMVVPWVGFPLGDLIKRFEPTSNAKYVKFETLYRPEEMRGQRGRSLQWPYVEGLRMDEAMQHLSVYMRTNRIYPSADKTQLLLVPRRLNKKTEQERELQCEMDGEKVQPTPTVKILGAVLDEQLNGEGQATAAAHKATSALRPDIHVAGAFSLADDKGRLYPVANFSTSHFAVSTAIAIQADNDDPRQWLEPGNTVTTVMAFDMPEDAGKVRLRSEVLGIELPLGSLASDLP